MDYVMISFENTHSAMAAEKLLRESVPVLTMPTLRSVTRSCGISLRLRTEDYGTARDRLRTSGIGPSLYAIYRVDADGRAVPLGK